MIVADTLTVDVHEGCIRAKLSILFIIIDVDRYASPSLLPIEWQLTDRNIGCERWFNQDKSKEVPNVGSAARCCKAMRHQTWEQ